MISRLDKRSRTVLAIREYSDICVRTVAVANFPDSTEFCPFAPDGEVCLANPDLTFILLAIKNFSNYIDALTTALMGVHGIVQGKVGKLVENFMPGADVSGLFLLLCLLPTR